MDHDAYMRYALLEAEKAKEDGEVPVGCVIADEKGTIVGRGYNRREKERNALAHAEIEAIDEACRTLNDWRLSGCSLYVTLEPCPMCAGAIINARIPKLYYGAKEEQSGACGSVINLFMERFGHSPQIVGGILEAECRSVMTGFFRKVRKGE
jgi:tRNA(adenine34) deaminase